MTDEVRLREIEERERNATAGPWKAYPATPGGGVAGYGFIRSSHPDADYVGDLRTLADNEFAAHAREDIPWLLARDKALLAEVAALQERLNERGKCDAIGVHEIVAVADGWMCHYCDAHFVAEATMRALREQVEALTASVEDLMMALAIWGHDGPHEKGEVERAIERGRASLRGVGGSDGL